MSADQARMIERVRALLRQAADPATTADEAQTFTAKAVHLMIRHRITEAQISADEGRAPEAVDLMEHVVIGVGGHGKARSAALARVAEAYGCQVALRGDTAGPHDRVLLVVGTASARRDLEMLLASVAVQMESAATRAAKAHMRQYRAARIRTRSQLDSERARFYRAFLRTYGLAVAQRIQAMRGQVRDEAAETSGGAELVLMGDADRVAAEFRRRFPRLGKGHAERTTSRAGVLAGYEHGRRADLGNGHLHTRKTPELDA